MTALAKPYALGCLLAVLPSLLAGGCSGTTAQNEYNNNRELLNAGSDVMIRMRAAGQLDDAQYRVAYTLREEAKAYVNKQQQAYALEGRRLTKEEGRAAVKASVKRLTSYLADVATRYINASTRNPGPGDAPADAGPR